jgi:hypothetical protein
MRDSHITQMRLKKDMSSREPFELPSKLDAVNKVKVEWGLRDGLETNIVDTDLGWYDATYEATYVVIQRIIAWHSGY